MKFLIVQLPPFSRHLIRLRSKYSSQNPVLKHPQPMYGLCNTDKNSGYTKLWSEVFHEQFSLDTLNQSSNYMLLLNTKSHDRPKNIDIGSYLRVQPSSHIDTVFLVLSTFRYSKLFPWYLHLILYVYLLLSMHATCPNYCVRADFITFTL
jgi:hypothetical protein